MQGSRINQESLPATTAFMGINPQNVAQLKVNERFGLRFVNGSRCNRSDRNWWSSITTRKMSALGSFNVFTNYEAAVGFSIAVV